MTPSTTAPAVDVVIPVLNGAATLGRAVESVRGQRYEGRVRIYVAVGPSADATWDVAHGLAGDPDTTVLENPSGTTPTALNLAIAAGHGDIIVRLDAQAALPPEYIARAVELLQETGAVNVGGVQRAAGTTVFERAVAAAMNSPLGAGDARYRIGGPAGPVETVYLGVFLRSAVEQAGGYDPRLIRNQDYELNWRLRQQGGEVYFHPDLEVEYKPRHSLREVARQYYEYGRWKRVVLRRHPSSIRWRQLAPPAVALANVIGLALLPWTRMGAVLPVTYVIGVSVGAALTSRDRSPAILVRLPAILATMHHAWAAGFLSSAPRIHRAGETSQDAGIDPS